MSRIAETKSTTGILQDLETRSTKAISIKAVSREPIMDETERIAFIQQFGRTYRAFMQAFESQVGQPMPRWRILLALHQHAGELSQKRLVERLRVDPGALTRQLKTLEALGWIARSVDQRDNRVSNVILTDAGRAVTEAGMPRRNAFLHDTLSTLPDDAVTALSGALRALEQRIQEVAAGTTEANDPNNAVPDKA
jgi:MarR family transcriptional regulator, organic hydroperoxide resistance regulator